MVHDAKNRSTKRKRGEPSTEDARLKKFQGKLHHDSKEVIKVGKKAKTFETQKLIKKLKSIRNKGVDVEEIASLEAQLNILKTIDHDAIAISALRAKLQKDRVLSQHSDVQTVISNELSNHAFASGPPGTPLAKVTSRLLSSKLLAVEVSAVLGELRSLVQPPLHVDTDVSEDEAPKKKLRIERKGGPTAKITEGAKDKSAELNEDEEELPGDGWESGTVRDDSPEPDDSGWESEFVQNAHTVIADESTDEDDGSHVGATDSEEEDASASADSTGAMSLPNPKKETSNPSQLQSTFLPSLSVGFIRGNSDDSDYEREGKVADINIKKNRRGQRARRAIWEKKYGRNANHKKKEFEKAKAEREMRSQQKARLSEKRPQRGLNASMREAEGKEPGPGYLNRTLVAPDEGGTGDRGKRDHAPSKLQKDDKPLHPSWEAKRRLKERESASILPSQGKKIKF